MRIHYHEPFILAVGALILAPGLYVKRTFEAMELSWAKPQVSSLALTLCGLVMDSRVALGVKNSVAKPRFVMSRVLS